MNWFFIPYQYPEKGVLVEVLDCGGHYHNLGMCADGTWAKEDGTPYAISVPVMWRPLPNG